MALGVAIGGAALGFLAGPALGMTAIAGASLGFTIGSLVGRLLFPPDPIHGPRIDDLSVMISEYGSPIPRGWGWNKFAGQVFWATDIVEERTEETQGGILGFGGQKIYHYDYYGNFSLLLCEGPSYPHRLWANGDLIWQLEGGPIPSLQEGERTPEQFFGLKGGELMDFPSRGLGISFEVGTEGDLPPALHEEFDGVGNVPGYRGVTKVHFRHFHLKDYGNRLPNVDVEVYAGPEGEFDKNRPVRSSEMLEGAEDWGASINVFAPDWERRYAYTVRNWSINYVSRVNLDTMIEDLRTEYTSEFNDVIGVAHDGTVVIVWGSGNSRAIKALDPETLDIIGSFGQNNSGLGMTDERFEAVRKLTPVSNGSTNFIACGSIFSSLGILEVPSLRYVWHENGDSHVSAMCGLDNGTLYVVRTPTYHGHLNSGLIRIYKLTVTTFSVDSELIRSYTYTDLHEEATNSSGVIDSIIYDQMDGNLIFPASIEIGGSFKLHLFKVNSITGEILWKTEIDHWPVVGPPMSYSRVTRGLLGWVTADTTPDLDSEGNAASGNIGTLISTLSGEILIEPNREGPFWPLATQPYDTQSYDGDTNCSFGIQRGGIPEMEYSTEPGPVGEWCFPDLVYEGIWLRTIVQDISQLCGMIETDDLDTSALMKRVTGYKIARIIDGRKAIEPLQVVYHFDGIETDGMLKFKWRDGPVVETIDIEDLGTVVYGSERTDKLVEKRQQEIEIPWRITVTFVDKEREYQTNTTAALRHRETQFSDLITDMQLPLTLTPDEAKQVAIRNLYLGVQMRTNYEFTLPRKYGRLDPGDIITVPYEDINAKVYITELNNDNGLISIRGLSHDEAIYVETDEKGTSAPTPPQTVFRPVQVDLALMNPPLLIDQLDPASGFPVAVKNSDADAEFRGAKVLVSEDDTIYEPIATVSVESVMGTTLNGLLPRPHTLIDRDSVLRVRIGKGSLSSITFRDLMNGRSNAIMVGDELCFFQKAVQISTHQWDLSVFRRGVQGSEWATDNHTAGDQFVLLGGGVVLINMDSTHMGDEKYYKAVPPALVDDMVPYKTFTAWNRHWWPLAPAHLYGDRTVNDLTITWTRRARKQREWTDFVDAPLDEPFEKYVLRIKNGAVTVRSTTIDNSTTFVYTEAMQVADFGSPQSSVDVEVAQISPRVGEGYVQARTL